MRTYRGAPHWLQTSIAPASTQHLGLSIKGKGRFALQLSKKGTAGTIYPSTLFQAQLRGFGGAAIVATLQLPIDQLSATDKLLLFNKLSVVTIKI